MGGTDQAAIEYSVLRFNVLETGKMAKRRDANGFDKGQTVMDRLLAQSISKTAFVECSRFAVGHYLASVRRKEQWWTSNRVMGGQGSMMHVGSESWPLWSEPTNETQLLKC